MRQEKLIIWGASGHARVVADIVKLEGRYELAAFLDDTALGEREFLGSPVYRSLQDARRMQITQLIVAIGDCNARTRLAGVAKNEGFELATAIHPKAVVASDAFIGEGTVLTAGAIVNPGAVIGSNVIVNTAATVDHEGIVGDGAHLSPGVHLGGKVRIGERTWIGIGAVVKDRVSIGSGTLVGAGAVVLSDLPDGVKAWGVPARIAGRIGE